MNYLRPLLHHYAQQITYCNDAYYDKKDEQMGVGERAYELRDRVVGHHACEKQTLMHPSHGHLVTRHLYPYRIAPVISKNPYVSHHQMVVFIDIHGVCKQPVERFFGLLLNERQGVAFYYKIEVA